MKKTSLLAFLAISAVISAQQQGHKITMVFTDTDAAYVLQAVSKQTGENILYSSKNKISVTLNLAVDSTDDAIRAVTAAAGLVYRHVGSLYIVAPAASMKDALAPYATTTIFTIDAGSVDSLVTKLQANFPYATVSGAGDKVSFTATKVDLLDAQQTVKDWLAEQRTLKPISELYAMQRIPSEEVGPLIKALFPTLEVTASSQGRNQVISQKVDENGTRLVQQSFGFVALRGPEDLVKAARATLEKMDAPVEAIGGAKVIVKSYELKYLNGPSVTAMLKKTFPEMDVFVGPEQFSPNRAQFNPLASQISSGSASGSSGSGGAGGGSTGGGSTSTGSTGGSTGGSTTSSTGTGGTGGAVGSHATVAGDRAKAIILRGRSSDIEQALNLVASLDVKPAQVTIEVKVIETSPTESANLGLSYTFSPVNFFDVGPGTAITALTSATGLTGGTTSNIVPQRISRTPLNFAATLNAMVSHQTAKLLATPSLQVIDNDQGSIFIGNTISVELTSATSLGGQTQSIASFPVGIILLISPHISPDGTVTMHVNPVVSTVSSINADGIPQTAAREAETTMIVKDGDTVIIGGLIQDQDTKTVTEVPWLSSLPLIGELFKTRNSSRTREDIIISITPHIVKESPETKK